MIIPANCSTVTSYLFVKDGPGFIKFLKSSYDAEDRLITMAPDNSSAKAQIAIGSSIIMITRLCLLRFIFTRTTQMQL
jgi:hypothetical protein